MEKNKSTIKTPKKSTKKPPKKTPDKKPKSSQSQSQKQSQSVNININNNKSASSQTKHSSKSQKGGETEQRVVISNEPFIILRKDTSNNIPNQLPSYNPTINRIMNTDPDMILNRQSNRSSSSSSRSSRSSRSRNAINEAQELMNMSALSIPPPPKRNTVLTTEKHYKMIEKENGLPRHIALLLRENFVNRETRLPEYVLNRPEINTYQGFIDYYRDNPELLD